MSDNASTAETGTEGATPEAGAETPTVETLLAEVEALKGHSRKWEDRAKANTSAADELAALKASQMTDDEKAQAAIADTEKRASDAEERASKAEAALLRYEIATEHGLDGEDVKVLAKVTDEATLRALAERLSGRSGPQPNPSQGRSGGTVATTPAQAFADAMDGLF